MLFAFLSLGVNLLLQIIADGVLSLFQVFTVTVYKNLTIAIFIKTGIATIGAFLFKFAVDKWLLFKDHNPDIKNTMRQIVIYGMFAVFTTLIFWGFEFGFKLLFHFRFSEYAGGVIGLVLGYTLKFIFDSRFVFNRPLNSPENDE